MAKGPRSTPHANTNKTLRIKRLSTEINASGGEERQVYFFSSLARSISFFSFCLRELPSRPRWQMGVVEKWPFGVWHQRSHGRAFESSGWGRQALDRSQRRGGSSGGLQAKRTPINQSVWAVLTIHLSLNVPEERKKQRERQAKEEQGGVRVSNLNSQLTACVSKCEQFRYTYQGKQRGFS